MSSTGGSGPSPFGLKVKSFSLSGGVNRTPLNKKELEKRKKLEDEAAAAEAYQDFVETFVTEPEQKKAKMFVRGSLIVPGVSGEQDTSRTFYQPSKLQNREAKRVDSLKKSVEAEKHKSASDSSSGKPAKKSGKEKEKKKSNLELFKEELKLMQQEREDRHRIKAMIKQDGGVRSAAAVLPIVPSAVIPEPIATKPETEYRVPGLGSFDTGDPNTTNIYLGNIHPKMAENQLMEIFGKYGALASVKVMWPRTDEERARNRNCGFVAFMNRKDGERAIRRLNGKEFMGYEMKLGWGKAVPIPPQPVYIPPKLQHLSMPPPTSGLPFNAQPAAEDVDKVKPGLVTPQNYKDAEIKGILERAIVKVVIPTDKTVLQLIHRLIEFVVNEGPMFEAMVMNREMNNPMYRFLFENTSPAHIYYRWKLYSILQGDETNKWRTGDFRMFEGGSLWRPPAVNFWTDGVTDEMLDLSPERVAEKPSTPVSSGRDVLKGINRNTQGSNAGGVPSKERGFRESKEPLAKRGVLTDKQREDLEEKLRNLTPDKSKIAESMVFCIEHADSADEIVDCITESLVILETPLFKKIARFYLVSDILHNCSVKVANASLFRKAFESRLETISQGLHECFSGIEGRLKAEHFKQRVMGVFRAWEDWAIYASDFLVSLQNLFLGLIPRENKVAGVEEPEEDLDGVPLDSDDVDGQPIDDNILF